MNAPKPTATGTLAKTPLSNLLVYGLDRRLDGTLVVEHAGARSAVRFLEGVPVKVRLAEPRMLLGELLVESGVLDKQARDQAVSRAAQEGTLLGRVVVRDGAVGAEDVHAALATQVLRRLHALAELPGDAVYGYYAGQDFLANYGEPRGAEAVDALGVIWDVVRARAAAEHVEAAVARLSGRPLKLHQRSRPGRFGFGNAERAVVDLLRAKPYELTGLLATGVLGEFEIKQVLYVLALTRHLDLGSGADPLGVEATGVSPAVASRQTSPRRQPPPRPPTGEAPVRRRKPEESPAPAAATTAPDDAPLTPEQEAFRDELLRRVEGIGAQNYYEILGVDPASDAGTIRSAFFQLAKQWHPDRIPRVLAEHKETASKIFARMTEAHQVLSSEEQRREYDQLMKEGGATADEQEQVQKVLRAATAFQKAEFFAKKSAWADAEREVKFALDNDPEQPEYTAFYADVLARQAGRKQFDDLVNMVNQAKKAQENNMKIRLYRARVLQRAGQTRAAFNEFQQVAEADPHNVEAAREVRLYRMRQGQSPADKGKKGGIANQDIGELFGKFFKR